MTLLKICNDVEISRKIYLQYSMLKNAVSLSSEDKKKDLLMIIIEVARKLESAKYHKENLLRILSECLENSQIKKEGEAEVADLSTGAESEYEAFLMAGKSTLDILVKILNPLVGINLHTYKNSGEQVIKSLKNNLKEIELERAKLIIDLIEHDMDWIKKWFKNHRDQVAHFHSVTSSGVVAHKNEAGETFFSFPTTDDGVPIDKAVGILYFNLLGFCEDFIPAALSIKFWPGILLQIIPEDQVDTTNPVKFRLAAKI